MKFHLQSFLVNSSLIIACAIASLFLSFHKMLERELSFGDILTVSGLAMLAYAVHKLSRRELRNWILYLGIGIGAGMLTLGISQPRTIPSTQLLIPAVLTLNYIGFLNFGVGSVRENIWLKHIIVALTWAYTAMLPISTNSIFFWLAFTLVFFMILQLSVVFDLKDLQYDPLRGRSNLAIQLGANYTKMLAILFNVTAIFILSIIQYFWSIDLIIFIALLITLLVQITLVSVTTIKMSAHWYYLYLDATLILPGFIILIFNHL